MGILKERKEEEDIQRPEERGKTEAGVTWARGQGAASFCPA